MPFTIDDMVESIKTELGYPTISLYISDEQIKTLINKAIRRCAEKAFVIKTVERTVSGGVVDLSDLNVGTVRNVYPSGSDNDDNDLFGPDINVTGYGFGVENILAQIGYRARGKDLVLSDFYLDGDKLYIDDYSGTVFIEYIPKEITFDDLNSKWLSWVEKYATALTKMAEGRIRGKFRPQNAPFELDYSELISEGESAIQDLESKLETELGYWNIIR